MTPAAPECPRTVPPRKHGGNMAIRYITKGTTVYLPCTLPFPLRFLLAAEPKALSEVLAVVQRGISTFLIRRAGFTVASGAKTGAVTLIQRFGSALNLNIHLHMLFLHGACRLDGNKGVRP